MMFQGRKQGSIFILGVGLYGQLSPIGKDWSELRFSVWKYTDINTKN